MNNDGQSGLIKLDVDDLMIGGKRAFRDMKKSSILNGWKNWIYYINWKNQICKVAPSTPHQALSKCQKFSQKI